MGLKIAERLMKSDNRGLKVNESMSLSYRGLEH